MNLEEVLRVVNCSFEGDLLRIFLDTEKHQQNKKIIDDWINYMSQEYNSELSKKAMLEMVVFMCQQKLVRDYINHEVNYND